MKPFIVTKEKKPAALENSQSSFIAFGWLIATDLVNGIHPDRQNKRCWGLPRESIHHRLFCLSIWRA